MKITILNGSPQAGQFDDYLAELSQVLRADAHEVTRIDLREINLRYCVGCFGCWVKTPGICASRDASMEMDRAVINAEFVLWAAPLKMGFPAERLKMALDKHIPLIHPYMVVDQGEAHHLRRYPHSPRLGLLVEKEADTDGRDLEIVSHIFRRTALNFKSRLAFSLTTETPARTLAKSITSKKPGHLPLPKRLGPTAGMDVAAPGSLTLFNGSPRGSKGNTPLMLRELANGFGGPTAVFHLVRMKETEQMVQAFAEAECAVIGLPLYTDAMPAIVKHFIEALRPLAGRPGNPPVGFLVQSGFPEGLHSRYIERYLEKLAQRLGSPYLGTIVKGNGEATRVMPPNMNQGLFENLNRLGAGLAQGKAFDAQLLRKVATPERFPAILGPVFKVFLRLELAHSYFDNMLKENGAFEQRWAKPFEGD